MVVNWSKSEVFLIMCTQQVQECTGQNDNSPLSKRCRILSGGSTTVIWERTPKGCGGLFHIRMNRSGSYNTYPNLGGPFQSLHEADDAINRYVCAQQLATVQDASKRKKSSKSERIQIAYNQKLQFVQVILDKYNDDQNLFRDLAYEVKDVVNNQYIVERLAWFNHYNFTAKIKQDNDSDRSTPIVFFAEAMCLYGEDYWVISCCSMIKPDNYGLCYGCKNGGNVDMKHPSDVISYVGGHLDIPMPFERCDTSDSEEEEDEAERLHVDDSDEMAMLFD